MGNLPPPYGNSNGTGRPQRLCYKKKQQENKKNYQRKTTYIKCRTKTQARETTKTRKHIITTKHTQKTSKKETNTNKIMEKHKGPSGTSQFLPGAGTSMPSTPSGPGPEIPVTPPQCQASAVLQVYGASIRTHTKDCAFAQPVPGWRHTPQVLLLSAFQSRVWGVGGSLLRPRFCSTLICNSC